MYTLGQRIVSPDQARAPVRDTLHAPDALFAFACRSCGHTIALNPETYNGTYSDSDRVLGEGRGNEVRHHFQLMGDRSLAQGWPKLRIEGCASCDARYVVCVMEHEPHNGWYQWSVRGVTALVPRAAV